MVTAHRVLVAAAVSCALVAPAAAEVRTTELTYRQGDTDLKGFVAWDDAAKGKRPGVLVIHEWWGHNDHARTQAERLAKAGYVGFALDVFGDGKVAKHPDDAKKFVGEAMKDPQAIAARFDAAVLALKAQPGVDGEKIAAFGYCFGGGVALEMARAGRDLDAVVTFHGSLDPMGTKAEKGKFKPAVLVQTGGADPMIPKEKVQAFEQELKAAGAKVRVITYPEAKHSFTNPDAGKHGMPALAYDPAADEQSFEAATKFLKEVFGS